MVVVVVATLSVLASASRTRDLEAAPMSLTGFLLACYSLLLVLAFATIVRKKASTGLAYVSSTGVTFGLGSVYSTELSAFVSGKSLIAPNTWWALLGNPLAWAFVLNEIAAFVLLQFAMKRVKAATAGAAVSALVLVVPTIAAILVFGELLSAGTPVWQVTGRLAGIGGLFTSIAFMFEGPGSIWGLKEPQAPSSRRTMATSSPT
ncbi:MAG: hypothetical protein Kow0069_17840 [Promethearchaeota archaeon]